MNYSILILTVIAPIFSVPLAIFESIRKKTSFFPLFCLAFFFSIFALSIIPPDKYDLYRHYEHIDSLKGVNFFQIIEDSRPGYVLFDSYAWLINTLEFPKQFFTGSIVLVSYILVFLVFYDIKLRWLQSATPSTIFLVFLSFWLAINFVHLSSGLRNSFSNIILFYIGYNYLFYNKKLLFIFGAIFAFFVHPFAILPIVIIFFAKWFKRFSSFGKLLVCLSIFCFIFPNIVISLMNSFENLLSVFPFYKSKYFQSDHQWGAGYIGTRNIKGTIGSFIIQRISIYIATLYVLLVRPQKNNPMYLLLCCMLFNIFTFYFYFTLVERMTAIIVFFITIFFIYQRFIKHELYAGYFLFLYVGGLIVESLYAFYVYQDYLFNFNKIIYSPFALLIFD